MRVEHINAIALEGAWRAVRTVFMLLHRITFTYLRLSYDSIPVDLHEMENISNIISLNSTIYTIMFLK